MQLLVNPFVDYLHVYQNICNEILISPLISDTKIKRTIAKEVREGKIFFHLRYPKLSPKQNWRVNLYLANKVYITPITVKSAVKYIDILGFFMKKKKKNNKSNNSNQDQYN